MGGQGNLLGLTLADVFLGVIERKALDIILGFYLYNRYVGDILIFSDEKRFIFLLSCGVLSISLGEKKQPFIYFRYCTNQMFG